MMCLHGCWRNWKSSHSHESGSPSTTRYRMPGLFWDGTSHTPASKMIFDLAAISRALSCRMSMPHLVLGVVKYAWSVAFLLLQPRSVGLICGFFVATFSLCLDAIRSLLGKQNPTCSA